MSRKGMHCLGTRRDVVGTMSCGMWMLKTGCMYKSGPPVRLRRKPAGFKEVSIGLPADGKDSAMPLKAGQLHQ